MRCSGLRSRPPRRRSTRPWPFDGFGRPSEAAIELAERKQKIFTLKSKYDNVMCKVKKEDGEEQKSQAHYMIKARTSSSSSPFLL